MFHARPAGGACTLGLFVVYFCDTSSIFVEAAPVHFETLGRLLLAHVVYFWERGDRALWGVLSSTFGACRLLLENTKPMNVSHFFDGAACAACMSSTFGKGASVHFGGWCRLLLVNVVYFGERSSCALWRIMSLTFGECRLLLGELKRALRAAVSALFGRASECHHNRF